MLLVHLFSTAKLRFFLELSTIRCKKIKKSTFFNISYLRSRREWKLSVAPDGTIAKGTFGVLPAVWVASERLTFGNHLIFVFFEHE